MRSFNLLDHHPREHGTLQVLRDKGLFSAIQHYRKESIWPDNVSHISTALLWIAYALSLLGVGSLIYKKQSVLLILLVGTIAYFILLPGAPSTPRFRVPVEPGYIFAGSQWVHIWRKCCIKVLNIVKKQGKNAQVIMYEGHLCKSTNQ